MNLIRQKQIEGLLKDISNLHIGSDVFNRDTSFTLGNPGVGEAHLDNTLAGNVTTLHINVRDTVAENRYLTLSEYQKYDTLIIKTKSGEISKYEITSISQAVDVSNEGHFILTLQHSFGYSSNFNQEILHYYFRKSAADELILQNKFNIISEENRALGAEAALQNQIDNLGTWNTGPQGPAGRDGGSGLIAMTMFENDTAADHLAYDVHYYQDTAADHLYAIAWDFGAKGMKYAKISFTIPDSGCVRVVFDGYLRDAGGTSECWMGLHTQMEHTQEPTYGWFQITKHFESDSYSLENAEWILRGLTPGEELTVWFHAVTTTSSGTQFLIGNQRTSPWSNADVPRPTVISVYDIDVTIKYNP